MKEAYIVDGIRTPVGSFTGTLSPVRADDLGALVIKELVKRNPEVPAEAINDVIMGCAN
ncbi:MAG TPA: 3-oxoadipyl-CoA thiolase, partial [Cytophagales bacterium]|nr:3-oxoadipyl-CoA thiolase [Cytophagales bacterium]